MNERCKYLIIGAGIAGASIACELAPLGRVVVLEQEQFPGYHATGRSAALFIRTYGNPVVRALTGASLGFLSEPPQSFAEYPLLEKCGCLYVGRADQMGALRQMSDVGASIGCEMPILTAGEVLRQVPVLRRDYVAGGVLEESAMNIDVNAFHRGYLRLAKQSGAELITSCRVDHIERVHDGFTVRTADQSFRTEIIVNAAGAWADKIGALAGAATVGLMPMRRTIVLAPAPADEDFGRWPVTADIGGQFYFKPDAGQLLISPANEDLSEPSDVQPDEMDVAIGIDRIQQATRLDIARVNRSWAGLRSFAADRTPVVGFDSKVDGFFWFAGQGGFGMQTAPALAKVGAAIMQGKRISSLLAESGVTIEALSPSRPILSQGMQAMEAGLCA